MFRLFRRLLACLLMLALPLQGLAAGVGAHCLGHGPAVQADGHGHDHAATTDHGADAVQGDEGHGPFGVHGESRVPDVPEGTSGSDDPGRCSACAACCAAALLPATTQVPATPPLPAIQHARRPASAAAFLTSGPERPPRSPAFA